MNIYWLLFIIMKKKKFLQRILDTSLKSQIKKTFGEKSHIKVSNITYVRSKDSYVINTTLYLDDIENSIELYPDGLELIIKQGWDVIGDKKPIMIHSSLDVPQ
jgi:hypothetical protein